MAAEHLNLPLVVIAGPTASGKTALAISIAQKFGGEERSKADYYLVTTNAQRLADVAVSLTIQANTSIGTTPILLALEKDLPKAQKELARLVDEQLLQKGFLAPLERLVSASSISANSRNTRS